VIAFIVWQLGRAFAGAVNAVGLVFALAALALLLWQLFKPYKEAQRLTVQ
jgi:ferrous iron transport protein B